MNSLKKRSWGRVVSCRTVGSKDVFPVVERHEFEPCKITRGGSFKVRDCSSHHPAEVVHGKSRFVVRCRSIRRADLSQAVQGENSFIDINKNDCLYQEDQYQHLESLRVNAQVPFLSLSPS